MKILHILPSLNFGGAEVMVTNMAIMAKNYGHEVSILLFNCIPNHLYNELQKRKIQVFVPSKNRSVYSLFNVIFLIKILQKNHFDIVHSHLTPAQLWGRFSSFFLKPKGKFITSEHSTYNRRRKLLLKPLDFIIYSAFHKIITISEAAEKELIKWLPNLSNKCVVIHNGIDIKQFRNVTASTSKLAHNKIAVVCVGRFNIQKGHSILLHAFAKITNAELFLVGDGERRNHIRDLCSNLNLNNRVHFLGARSDIPTILNMADIYIQPSLREGFGIATLEAMASGLPVIASNVGGLRDIVADAGILVEPNNAEDLYAKLQLLIDNPNLRQKFAGLAIKRAQNFSLEKTWEKHLSLYVAELSKNY